MAKEMHIVVPGKPIAKKRPRFFAKATPSGKIISGTYKDDKEQTEEGKFLLSLTEQIKNHNIEDFYGKPLFVEFTFVFVRPKSHFGSGKNANVLKPSAPYYHVVKPDCDNAVKYCKDCMNKVVYGDDSQVVGETAWKVYGEKEETKITIRALEGETINSGGM